MPKNELKDEIRGTVQEFVSSVMLCKIFFDGVTPGGGDALVEVLQEELEKLKTKAPAATSDGSEAVYRTTDGMSFGLAIEAVKQGKSVARKGWNGKNQFVELATCISYKGNAGEIVNAHHNDIGNKALAFIGTSGVQMGWLASQADMLADDWYIVE